MGIILLEKTTFVNIVALKLIFFYPRREPRKNHENAGSNMKMPATMRYCALGYNEFDIV
jgi:hypothetical protein